jgi:hypothetical protein
MALARTPPNPDLMQFKSTKDCILDPNRTIPYYIVPRYVDKVPFVLGTSPSLPATLLVACLSATASALKALSALWWSLSPLIQSTCIVILAACAKLCKQCGIISQLKSPSFSLFRPRSMTLNGLFERSTTARERASSRGAYADPNRTSPVGAPRASLNALPSAMHTSSAVW